MNEWLIYGVGVASGVVWVVATYAWRGIRTAAPAPASGDSSLADWCRHMSLTVVTVSGAVFSSTLAELQGSDVPDFRNWNVPTQVVLWSDRADTDLIADAQALAQEKGNR